MIHRHGQRPVFGGFAGHDDNKPEQTDRRRLFLGVGWTLLIFLLCLFLPAGNWAWARGWLFFFVIVGTSILITLYLRRVNPDVIAARVNRHDRTKGWDRWLLGILIPAMVSILPVAALDDGRFHWSHVPCWVCGIGYVLLVAGLAGMTWAESVNRFFEPTVRIQTDRGHRVIDTGLRPRPSSRLRRRLPPLRGHAPVPGFILGAGPRRPVVLDSGRANDLGGQDTPGFVLQGYTSVDWFSFLRIQRVQDILSSWSVLNEVRPNVPSRRGSDLRTQKSNGPFIPPLLRSLFVGTHGTEPE